MVQFNKLRRAGKIYNRRSLILLVKAVLSLAVLAYGYRVYRTRGSAFGEVSERLAAVLTFENLPLLLLLIAFIPLNWALESWKWQRLASKVVALSFREAVRSTLMGVLAGVTLPAQFGEAAGRVLSLDAAQRSRTLGAAVVSGGIQFYASVFSGWAGLVYLDGKEILPSAWRYPLHGMLLLLTAVGLWAFTTRKAIIGWRSHRPWIRRIRSYMVVIGLYSGTELLGAFFIGLLRYAVYLGQYVGVLLLFGFSLTVGEMAAGVATVLLVKTVVPALNMFGDLGMRGITGLYVFGSMGIPAEKIVAATLVVWVINILAPVCVGLVVLWKSEWRSNGDRK